MQESHKRVQWVYEATNDKELEGRYDQWAADYDSDLAAEFAWSAPQNATAVFVKHVDKSAHILDAGAGTGLVGECLAGVGYKDVLWDVRAAYRKGNRLIFLYQDVDIVWQHKRKWRRRSAPREEFSFLFNILSPWNRIVRRYGSTCGKAG